MAYSKSYLEWGRGSGIDMTIDLTQIKQVLPAPFYETGEGAAYHGDGLKLMRSLPDCSVDLIMTSPPFALRRKKEYGNVDASEYVRWFRPFSNQMLRILKDTGSLVIHIGGSWNKGIPTRSLYHYQLLIALCKSFHLAQEFFWFNPAKLPSPAEWVTVRRIRVKDAVDYVWWLSKSSFPKADNRAILQKYSESMNDLFRKGYKAKRRPSGHDISDKFDRHRNGSIPPNIFTVANTDSNGHYLRACRNAGIKPHPARYPRQIPEFFIKFLTEAGDVVLDPFAGSNVTGESAEQLRRSCISFEIDEQYLIGSKFRFEQGQKRLISEETPGYSDVT